MEAHDSIGHLSELVHIPAAEMHCQSVCPQVGGHLIPLLSHADQGQSMHAQALRNHTMVHTTASDEMD